MNGVLGENTTRTLEYDLPEAGATIIVTSTDTAIVRYSCKVQNPDDSTADYIKQFKGQTEYYAKCKDPPSGCFNFGFGKRQAPPVVSKKLYVSLESLTRETSFTVNAVEGDVLTRDGKMKIYFIKILHIMYAYLIFTATTGNYNIAFLLMYTLINIH